MQLTFSPLTSKCWKDFETLFGPRGGCAGCWCMWPRLKRSDFEKQKGEDNRQAMSALVDSGQTPGILAYQDGSAVGWCAVAPRSQYGTLARSRILRPIDGKPVWSIICFFVAKSHRRQGVTEALITAAIDHAASRGAEIIEGYPIAPEKESYPATFAYTGFHSTFLKTGFIECARRSPTRPIMRYYLLRPFHVFKFSHPHKRRRDRNDTPAN